MNKYLLIIAAIMIASYLAADIYQSPNGYTFEHIYDYYEDFEIANDDGELAVDLSVTSAINGPYYDTWLDYDHYVTSETPWFEVYVPEHFAYGIYMFKLYLDGNHICTMDASASHGSYVMVDEFPSLTLGSHSVQCKIYNAGGQNCLSVTPILSFSCCPLNSVYKNSFGDELYTLNTGQSSIKKPLLIIEGFDPTNSHCLPFYMELLGASMNELSDYDVYFLNLRCGGRDLRDNAMSALGAIRYIGNSYEQNGQLHEGTKVVGLSMGGVLARYALAFAEDNNIEHYCTQFISCDSPQRGAVINTQLQPIFQNLHDDLCNSWTSLFMDYSQEIYDTAIGYEKLRSIAATQMLRQNVYSSQINTYATGSSEYLNFYSEINPEARALYNPSYPILNQSQSNPDSKPGYPYKQHNIKSLAISNGMLIISGNTESGSHLLDWEFEGHNYDADDQPWDTQSGSTLGLKEALAGIPEVDFWCFHFDAPEYDPCFIPLRSSLYLKTQGTEDTNLNDSQFAIDVFDIINIPNGVDTQEYLSAFSYFDDVIIQPNDRYQHEYLSDESINQLVDWVGDPSLNATGYISGNIDNGNAIVREYIGDQRIFSSHVNPDGSFIVPYPLICSSDVRLTFEDDGYYNVDRTINIVYSEGSISHEELSVQMNQVNNQNIIVSPGNPDIGFETLNEAIDYISSSNETDFVVYLDDAIHAPAIINLLNGKNISIRGISQAGSIIEGSPCLIMNMNTNCSISVENFTVRNSEYGAILIDNEVTDFDKSQDCSYTLEHLIIDSNVSGHSHVVDHRAGGITINSNSSCTINIRSCEVSNNVSELTFGYDFGYGGGILISGGAEISVVDCTFTSNSAEGDAGAMYVQGTDNVVIDGNYFEANQLSMGYSYPEDCSGLALASCNNALVTNNVFYANLPGMDGAVELGKYALQVSGCSLVELANNTFVDNSDLTAIQLSGVTSSKIVNSIFKGNEKGVSQSYSENPDISYCFFYSNDTNLYPANLPCSDCTMGVDPQLDENFTPIWTATSRSPVIDAGDPYTNGTYWFDEGGQKDADGTRPDIGAVPAETHEGEIKTLEYIQDDDEYEWVCFPIIDTRTAGNDIAANYFGDMLDIDYINNIAWSDNEQIYLHESEWQNTDHQLTYTQGYIAKMNASYILEASGFLAPSNTTISLETNDNEPKWNWIGYFIPEDMGVLDAFDSVLDNISRINTERWAIVKDKYGNWVPFGTSTTPTVKRVLRYGEAVKVYCETACEFCWGDDNIVPSDDGFKSTEYYTFSTDEDYATVIVEVEAAERSMPQEIAVFLNGECRGASVVQDTLVQINAYVVNDTTGNDIEIELYYGDRSPAKTYKDYAVLDFNTRKLTGSRLNIKDNGVYYIDLGMDAEEIIPVETVMEQNYPNPFNPTTTIKYSLNQDGPIEIAIYNLKGQKVRQLINASMTAGFHEVVWDGKDSYGKQASSGIYFYRMKTQQKTFVKKMMMIK